MEQIEQHTIKFPEVEDPIKCGNFIFEYTKSGVMVNWHTISYVNKKKPEFTAGRLSFENKIQPDGQVKPIRRKKRGINPSKFFVMTESTELDFTILRLRRLLLREIEKITDVEILTELYAQAKAHNTKA